MDIIQEKFILSLLNYPAIFGDLSQLASVAALQSNIEFDELVESGLFENNLSRM